MMPPVVRRGFVRTLSHGHPTPSKKHFLVFA
jgi:hypothetical protein